jgi:xanthine dehydrogenase small subunit
MTQTFSPSTVQEALALKAEYGRDVTVLAGGTDLMVYIQARSVVPTRVLNLWGVAALRGVSLRDDALHIGALETYTDLINNPVVQECAPALVAASRTVGAIQIQNRGTLGGNLANASPAADTPPVLMACDARMVVTSAGGSREIAITDFFRGYKDMDLGADELITSIIVPAKAATHRDWFVKVGTRRAQAISKVVMGGRATRAADGTLSDVGLSSGSVAATTIRMPAVEALMNGRAPDEALESEVRACAAAAVQPIDDIRSTADYRRKVVGNVAARFVRYLRANP